MPAILPRGHTHSSSVEDRRRKLRELESDLRRVEAAPRPSSVAKQIAAAEIEKLASRGAVDVMATVVHGEGLRWPKISVSTHAPGTTATGTVIDAAGLMCFVHRAALLAAVNGEIDAVADDEHALTDAARAEKLAEVMSDILAVERQEEALICAAESAGSVILRRAECDPRAVLNLSDSLPGPDRS